MSERWLVIYAHDAPVGDGYWEFRKAAERFAKYITKRVTSEPTLATFSRKDSLIKRRLDVLAKANPRPFDHAAFFGHGWQTGVQCGLHAIDWPRLLSSDGLHRIALYACYAGEGPGTGGEDGYADDVREAMAHSRLDATVIAHRTKGPATTNPTWALFSSATPDDGGVPLANFNDPKWRSWLKSGDHRWELAVDPLAWQRRVK